MCCNVSRHAADTSFVILMPCTQCSSESMHQHQHHVQHSATQGGASSREGHASDTSPVGHLSLHAEHKQQPCWWQGLFAAPAVTSAQVGLEDKRSCMCHPRLYCHQRCTADLVPHVPRPGPASRHTAVNMAGLQLGCVQGVGHLPELWRASGSHDLPGVVSVGLGKEGLQCSTSLEYSRTTGHP